MHCRAPFISRDRFGTPRVAMHAEYTSLPHWLMIAGSVLVLTGVVGLLVRPKKVKEPDPARDQPIPRRQMAPLPGLLASKNINEPRNH
jgi:hypothetical protein